MMFKKRKGQNIVIEEVLLVGMGIILLIGLTSVFTMAKDEISISIQKQEASQIGNYINGHINRLALNNITGTMTIPIPSEVNDRYYMIEGYESGAKKEFFIMLSAHVQNINTSVPVKGIATSQNGLLFINHSKENGEYTINIRS